jgi:UDP-glucose 4-epimerase
MGTGREVRDWLHVADAAGLTITAATQASRACPVANGGTGAGLPVREILESLRGAFPQAPPLAFLGAARPGDPEVYVADAAEALAWGWRPEQDLHTGIRAYAEWFLQGAP